MCVCKGDETGSERLVFVFFLFFTLVGCFGLHGALSERGVRVSVALDVVRCTTAVGGRWFCFFSGYFSRY